MNLPENQTMSEMIELTGRGLSARVAAHPISERAYKAYLHATGQPIAHFHSRSAASGNPVTYVSQVDAVAYCRWLSTQEHVPYRLPTIAELLGLAGEAADDGISSEIWSHHHANRPETPGYAENVYLCEWSAETEEVPGRSAASPARILGSVFYPPWLREGNNPTHIQAYLLATEGYSFITFRVACDR